VFCLYCQACLYWISLGPTFVFGIDRCSVYAILSTNCLCNYTPAPWRGVYCFTSVRLSVPPSFQDIFHCIFLSNYLWQKSDIWSQASYRYPISWEVFLDPLDSYFLFADLVGFYTHWTYMRGYHKWTLAHTSSCLNLCKPNTCLNSTNSSDPEGFGLDRFCSTSFHIRFIQDSGLFLHFIRIVTFKKKGDLQCLTKDKLFFGL
jgi:hypothetical protein